MANFFAGFVPFRTNALWSGRSSPIPPDIPGFSRPRKRRKERRRSEFESQFSFLASVFSISFFSLSLPRQAQQPKDKYFNHKKPQRPDVTKMKVPFPDAVDSTDSHRSDRDRSSGGRDGAGKSKTNKNYTTARNSFSFFLLFLLKGGGGDRGMPKMPKFHHKDRRKDRGDNDTDHLAEITQLKEKIASLQKTIHMKSNQLIAKQAEMTQMKAKLFNDENVIKEKMRKMAKVGFSKSGVFYIFGVN